MARDWERIYSVSYLGVTATLKSLKADQLLEQVDLQPARWPWRKWGPWRAGRRTAAAATEAVTPSGRLVRRGFGDPDCDIKKDCFCWLVCFPSITKMLTFPPKLKHPNVVVLSRL